MRAISTFERLLRFCLVGGAATLLYGVASLALVYWAGLHSIEAHLLAYALVVPLSFFGQKRITFGFTGDQGRAFFRFVVTSTIALALSTWVVWIVRSIGYPALYGTAATMLIVPLVSYLMMAFWVFLERTEI